MLNNDPLSNVRNTDWHDFYIQTTDLYLCDETTILAAHGEAPTEVAKAYVYGIYESRKRVSLLSGARF